MSLPAMTFGDRVNLDRTLLTFLQVLISSKGLDIGGRCRSSQWTGVKMYAWDWANKIATARVH